MNETMEDEFDGFTDAEDWQDNWEFNFALNFAALTAGTKSEMETLISLSMFDSYINIDQWVEVE